MIISPRYIPIFLVVLLLIFLPHSTFASHEGLGGYADFMTKIAVGVLIAFIINLALCIWNVKKKNTVLSGITIVLTLLISGVLFVFSAAFGSVGVATSVIMTGIHSLLIYKAFKT